MYTFLEYSAFLKFHMVEHAHICTYIFPFVVLASPAANTTSWTGSASSQIEVSPSINSNYHIATRCVCVSVCLSVCLSVGTCVHVYACSVYMSQ